MNPYAAQDRAEAEREAEGEAYSAWCEANDLDMDEDHSDAWAAYLQDLADSQY